MKPITSFRGEYFFLSNYYTAPFVWRNLEFTSGEQAFSYAKTFMVTGKAQENFQRAILAAKTPGEAKKLGRQAPLEPYVWDTHKVNYMREITHAKFAGVPRIAGLLINTGPVMLIEGNDWGDTTWGRCKNENGLWVGLNLLGAILMECRGYWLHHKLVCPHCKAVVS